MRNYLIKRFLLIFPTLFGITVITFIVIHLTPGDPAALKIKKGEFGASNPITKEMLAETRKLYGLDKPLHVQYWMWIARLAKLDFGKSFKDQRPVIEKIKEALPITILLNAISIALIYIVAIPIGLLSAVKRKTALDNFLTVLLFVLYSLPSFWVAQELITYFAGGDYFDFLPAYGLHSDGIEKFGRWSGPWIADGMWHLILPVTCLTYGGFAYLSRMQRVGMLEVIRQDYIRTARAKGLSEYTVITKHGLRNALIPIITMMAGLLPAMIGGSVIIEQIFNIRGMGKLMFEAISNRDFPVVMGEFVIGAVLTLLGLILSDILYVLVDPRISFDEAGNE